MARRTKADAQETRAQILDAAESVFEQRGVSRATLNEIAAAAGVTRGAIYWHFADKSEIFDAMMQRVMLPLEEGMHPDTGSSLAGDAMAVLRAGMVRSLRQVVENDRVRRVFEIALHKVEYVDELYKVRERRVEALHGHIARIRQAFEEAVAGGRRLARLDPQQAAIGLHAMIAGLFEAWMLEPEQIDLVEVGGQMFDTFVSGAFLPDAMLEPVAPTAAGACGLEARR